MSRTFRLICRDIRRSFNPVKDLEDLAIRHRILKTIQIQNSADINYAINQLKIVKECNDKVIIGYLIYKKKPSIGSQYMELRKSISIEEDRIYNLIEKNSGMNGRMNKYDHIYAKFTGTS